MGKKKRQKTKELSVAIAEASSTIGGETGQQQIQPEAPRKRGRPRKIVVETESEEKKTQPIEQAATTQGTESSVKEGKGSEDEQHGQLQEEGSPSSACIMIKTKEEGVSEEMQLPKGEASRSRARRKSKPRKSS